MGDRDVRPVREADGEAVQDVRGDLAAGRGRDPGGAGGRADGVGGVLLHRPGGDRGRHPRMRRRRLLPGDHVPRLQGVVGAGQQQVRFVWASVGAFHVCLWTFTMTEAWAWGRDEEGLVDRSASPWDDGSRRPSHADKRRAWRRELLGEEIRAVLRPGVTEQEIRPPPNGCSAWPHDMYEVPERTAHTVSGGHAGSGRVRCRHCAAR